MTKGVLRGGGDTKMLMLADNIFLWVLSIPLGLLAGGDRIGCHESHTQTADDHRHRIVADGENAVTDQHRYTDTDIFPYQILRLYEKISQPEMYFLIFEKEIAADHSRLKQPGDQCPEAGEVFSGAEKDDLPYGAADGGRWEAPAEALSYRICDPIEKQS